MAGLNWRKCLFTPDVFFNKNTIKDFRLNCKEKRSPLRLLTTSTVLKQTMKKQKINYCQRPGFPENGLTVTSSVLVDWRFFFINQYNKLYPKRNIQSDSSLDKLKMV